MIGGVLPEEAQLEVVVEPSVMETPVTEQMVQPLEAESVTH